jgi:hypothetical protein
VGFARNPANPAKTPPTCPRRPPRTAKLQLKVVRDSILHSACRAVSRTAVGCLGGGVISSHGRIAGNGLSSAERASVSPWMARSREPRPGRGAEDQPRLCVWRRLRDKQGEGRGAVKAPSGRATAPARPSESALPTAGKRCSRPTEEIGTGAAGPTPTSEGDYHSTRWSNRKSGSACSKRFRSGIGFGASSEGTGPRAGAIGDAGDHVHGVSDVRSWLDRRCR